MTQPGHDAWHAIQEPIKRAPPPAPPPPRRPALVTTILFVANIVIFGFEVLKAGTGAFAGLMSSRLLLFLGANSAFATIHEMRFETLVTSCFLHLNLLHIGFNMVALRQVGPFVERTAGPARMATLYIAAGIFASIASAVTGIIRGHESLSVGASGAICGLIGAALVIGWRLEGPRSAIVRQMANWLLSLIILGVVVSFAARGAGIDNAAHAGGAISGAAIAALWRRGAVSSVTTRTAAYVACVLLVLGAGVRLAQINEADPYAMLSSEDRSLVVMESLKRNDCKTAQEAVERLANVSPNATAEKNAVLVQCGAPRTNPSGPN